MKRNNNVLLSLYLISVVSHVPLVVRSQHQRDETKLGVLPHSFISFHFIFMALSYVPCVRGQVDKDRGTYVGVPIVGSATICRPLSPRPRAAARRRDMLRARDRRVAVDKRMGTDAEGKRTERVRRPGK
jgi:hypothetical protein